MKLNETILYRRKWRYALNIAFSFPYKLKTQETYFLLKFEFKRIYFLTRTK